MANQKSTRRKCIFFLIIFSFHITHFLKQQNLQCFLLFGETLHFFILIKHYSEMDTDANKNNVLIFKSIFFGVTESIHFEISFLRFCIQNLETCIIFMYNYITVFYINLRISKMSGIILHFENFINYVNNNFSCIEKFIER